MQMITPKQKHENAGTSRDDVNCLMQHFFLRENCDVHNTNTHNLSP
jgi:hypothetical protein